MRKSKIRKQLDRLSHLYEITGHDWILAVTALVTEDIPPTIILRPEHTRMQRYRADFASVEDGIARVCEMAYQEIVERQRIVPPTTYYNTHDTYYERWISRRIDGENDQLPEFPE